MTYIPPDRRICFRVISAFPTFLVLRSLLGQTKAIQGETEPMTNGVGSNHLGTFRPLLIVRTIVSHGVCLLRYKVRSREILLNSAAVHYDGNEFCQLTYQPNGVSEMQTPVRHPENDGQPRV
jgi:hypothetical protein